MKNKYYQGPTGVYYSPNRDKIFRLGPAWPQLFDIKKMKFLAPMFEYEDGKQHLKETAIIMNKNAIRIGDL